MFGDWVGEGFRIGMNSDDTGTSMLEINDPPAFSYLNCSVSHDYPYKISNSLIVYATYA